MNGIKGGDREYMGGGGERVPADILRVLFPVNYWPLIPRYSEERKLDPFMMAALIAQESTFTADAKSAANAYGLMQIIPSTGRQYARTLHLNKKLTLTMLTTA